MRGRLLRRWPRLALALGLVALIAAGTAIAIAPQRPYDLTFTAKSESEIQNIDVVRAWLKNYYGAPTAVAGSAASGTWNAPLNLDSNYAAEARSVAEDGAKWLNAHKPKKGEKKAIVLDVDDTSLTTWNYELFSNWIFDAVHERELRRPDRARRVPGPANGVQRKHVPGDAGHARPGHPGEGARVRGFLPHRDAATRSTRPRSPTSSVTRLPGSPTSRR